MIQTDPRNWQVLENGSPSQKIAYTMIRDSDVFTLLSQFDPAHVSTFANDLAIQGSDIDIVCHAPDLKHFESVLSKCFSTHSGFDVRRGGTRDAPTVVAYLSGEISIEIYAEAKAVEKQNGFRHYMIACRLLTVGGESLRQHIRRLKLAGIKTEPAFAQCLGLQGEPYQALLELEHDTDQQMKVRIDSRPE